MAIPGLADARVRAALKRPDMTGAEELRLLVSNMDATREAINDYYTAEELLQLYRMQLVSGWDFYPDSWTPRQRTEALKGRAPTWDHDERPTYGDPP